jgi:glycosyltransferase involved in cell wall biosynthesis
VIDGIHVHRVWTYLAANRGVALRSLNFLSFAVSGAWRAWRLGRFDVVVGTSPQFFCAVAAWVVARVRRLPWVFELRDLWPASLPAVGAVQDRSLAIQVLERLELRLYRDASAVACVTRGFVRSLAERGIDERKLHFVPNGIIPEFWSTGDRASARRDLGVAPDDVLLSYVGTTGMAHGLATVLDAMSSLRERAPRVRLLIAGDGAELDSLRAMAAAHHLSNVRFTGLVPRAGIPSLLAASDIMLVTLRPSAVFGTVLPSKMFEAMAAARPIVLGVEGEARDTLLEARAGLAIPPGDPSALVDAVCRLAGDPALRATMGESGRVYVEREYSRRVWASRYLALLEALSDTRAEPVESRHTVISR